MKRFIVLLFAATAALFVSCDKEEATVLEGEWLAFEDYYHPLYITFEGNNYIWDVRGIAPRRDAGTFTYDGDVLTLNAKEFWEMDENEKLKKVSSLDSPAEHKYKVLAFDGDILISKNLKDDFFYQGQETILEPGMMLLLYTDGLTEAMNSTHEQFGLQRVMNVIDNNVNMPSKQMLDKLHQATLEFVGNAEQSDDLTMFAVRYTPSEEQTLHSQELTIENDLSHISQVNDFVTEFCYKLNFDKSDTTNMRLAIEEAVVNIINYAYPEGEKGDIGIVASATNDTLKWVITDNGKHFAPTDAPDVDTSLSA